MEIFGIPLSAMLSQLLLGLVNGSFYAMLSLGLAVIFGLLNVINFAHGAMFMLGAMITWMGFAYFEIPYWVMLALAGIAHVVIELVAGQVAAAQREIAEHLGLARSDVEQRLAKAFARQRRFAAEVNLVATKVQQFGVDNAQATLTTGLHGDSTDQIIC